MIDFFSSFNAWLGSHPQWLGIALFLTACLECLALAGLLVPGTFILFGMGVLAGTGALDLSATLLLGFLGGLLGDAISYFLGRTFHQNIRALPVLRSHPEWIGSAENFFQRNGVVSLLVGRFIGPLRPMLPMVAGMLDMPFLRFALVSLVAAAGWSVAYLLPGWMTGAAFRLPLPPGFWPQTAIIAGSVTALLLVIMHATLHGHSRTTFISAGLTGVALLALLLGWSHLRAFDEGLMTLVQEHRQPYLNALAVTITRMGDFKTQLIVAVVLILLLAFFRHWRGMCLAIGALLGTAVANGTLKNTLARARPDILAEPLTTYSLPSGHSSASFAFFLTLGILAARHHSPRVRLAWLIIAALPALIIATTRVYLGVHWPTDVLAGALLAGACCALSLALVQREARLTPITQPFWWILLPLLIAVFAVSAGWALPAAIERYMPAVLIPAG
ncbi:undecaprenyl-diphosphatase [Pseudomonas duriflava]|uniref:Undecaprenyl-diphosphatase n=1 Tax=Pseudomonas duriflava TaxID=459528 RepID=A0A562QBV2_9PSED|nr:bifunctional DedA family/phosphatase PAP2 family protein [Pseudomonas duriflava]TWI54231.1 undecaprenyl-diphosphatase [Pseudomonas duriflava]